MNDNMNNQVVPNQPVQPQPMPNQVVPNQPVQPQPMPNQGIPNQNINTQIPVQPQQSINNPVHTTVGPQFAAPVQPITETVTQDINLVQEQIPTQVVQTSVVEENLAPSNTEKFDDTNSDNITIDYNALYGISNEQKEETQTVNIEEPVFTAKEIVIDSPSLTDRVKEDVVPEFNLNALEGNIDESENKFTDNVLTEKQQDRADTRRKLIYILVLFLLIAVFIIWIFPIISGYKI